MRVVVSFPSYGPCYVIRDSEWVFMMTRHECNKCCELLVLNVLITLLHIWVYLCGSVTFGHYINSEFTLMPTECWFVTPTKLTVLAYISVCSNAKGSLSIQKRSENLSSTMLVRSESENQQKSNAGFKKKAWNINTRLQNIMRSWQDKVHKNALIAK